MNLKITLLLDYDENIKVSCPVYKICKLCRINTHFKDYYCHKDSNSKSNSPIHFLNSNCKKCQNLLILNKKKISKNVINDFINNINN